MSKIPSDNRAGATWKNARWVILYADLININYGLL